MSAFAPVTDTMNTKQKIEKTFKCAAGHIVDGKSLLRNGRGYTCRYWWCALPVTDISDTEDGQSYHERVRPDLGVKK